MTKQKTYLRETARAYNRVIVRSWRQTLPITLSVILGTILIFYVPPLVIAQIIASEQTINLANGGVYLLVFGGAWLAGEMLWRLSFYIMAKFEARALETLYRHTLRELVYKDLSFFNDRFAGSITKNILAYARRFEGYYDTLTFGVFSQVGPIIFGLIVLTFLSPVLSATLLVITLAVFFLVRPLIARRSRLVKRREEKHAEMSGHVSDVIGNIAAVRAFGAEERELRVHEQHAEEYAQRAYETWQYHNTRIDMLISPFYVSANVLALAIVMHAGIDASTKAGLFLAFNYFLNISRFMWEFNSIYRRLEDALSDASLFVEYQQVQPKIINIPDAAQITITKGNLDMKDVAFAHQDNNESLFENFSLSVPSGQRVGLVGHSGAGKSTLVSLLMRFADVNAGSITIDGQDIKEVTQESLHHSVAYVPQEPLLFHRSLRENIAYGKPGATDEEIVQAAKQANALEFIEQLPKGPDTLVGERGVKLSGGQRQRIAIARAILKDAPILILDEATSALDSESEKLIQDALAKLMKGRTSIVIAHRLSTIAKLDRIVVLDKGTIIEDGTHAELLKKNGTYATLWHHQSGGFIEE
ncbi:MAG TPA: ABC transporter ATP-binding protein [Candidatus Saccharibacteria bacterium]|nr:ABC transporter ATP-binding protein [Candidatus Saccharibacteria bacterium]